MFWVLEMGWKAIIFMDALRGAQDTVGPDGVPPCEMILYLSHLMD